MKHGWAGATCLACCICPIWAEDALDRLDAALTRSFWDDQVRLRLSGTLDLEYFHTSDPPFGLFDSRAKDLFNPRLTFFLDAQLGPQLYAFVQARLDRGFDPSDDGARARLDEYALRWTPWPDGRISVQVGKFASVVGRWNARHLSWDNPFITAPLPYNQPTFVSDLELPYSVAGFTRGSAAGANYEYLPIIWNAAYATGISISGKLGKFEYAAEVKNASLSSRPESWDLGDTDFSYPTVSARLGFRPDTRWNFGVSASRGAYLRHDFEGRLPIGTDRGNYEQQVLGQDISFEWHHLQIWAEAYQARFEVPRIGNVDTFAYFIEAKYKFSPEFFGALRWNQQVFDEISSATGESAKSGADVWQVDAAIGYRFTPHTQLKLQYSLIADAAADGGSSHLLGVQFTTRF
jgi:hypothetical protein